MATVRVPSTALTQGGLARLGICPRHGLPATGLRKRTFFTLTPAWLYVLTAFTVLGGAIGAIILRKKVVAELPSCGRCTRDRALRFPATAISWTAAIALGAYVLADRPAATPILNIVLFSVALVLLSVALWLTTNGDGGVTGVVSADQGWVQLSRVSPEFVQEVSLQMAPFGGLVGAEGIAGLTRSTAGRVVVDVAVIFIVVFLTLGLNRAFHAGEPGTVDTAAAYGPSTIHTSPLVLPHSFGGYVAMSGSKALAAGRSALVGQVAGSAAGLYRSTQAAPDSPSLLVFAEPIGTDQPVAGIQSLEAGLRNSAPALATWTAQPVRSRGAALACSTGAVGALPSSVCVWVSGRTSGQLILFRQPMAAAVRATQAAEAAFER